MFHLNFLKNIKHYLQSGIVIFFYTTLLLCTTNKSFSQNRNEEVMVMNKIMKMMDEFSVVNQRAYFDAVNLHSFYSNVNELKYPENSLYSSKTTSIRMLGYYTGMEEFYHLIPEIKPDSKGMIPSYYSNFYRWLSEREQMEKLIKEGKINNEIYPYLSNYMTSADSFFIVHKRLNDYVHDKTHKIDSLKTQAEELLIASQHWFKTCLESSLKLDNILRDYYYRKLPPYKSFSELQDGLREIELTTTLLENWRKTLYSEDLTQDKEFDKELRFLHDTALEKDSILLYKTEGYGYPSDGSWAHTIYNSLFKSMESTIYWFATSTHQTEAFMKKSQKCYNEFLLSYNQLMGYYNRYATLTDGFTYENLLVCCPQRYERDTTVNVLLNKPRLLYKFEFTPKHPLPSESEIDINTSVLPSEKLSDEKKISLALPHHLVYLLDASASMNQFKKLTELKNNTKYLVNIQREVDKISMITFANNSEIIIDAISCDQKQLINSKIDKIQAQGQTNIDKGLKTTKQLLINEKKTIPNGVNTILIISDGEFLIAKKTMKIIKELRKNNIGICFINVGKNKGNKDKIQDYIQLLDIQYYDNNHENLKEILMKIATN